MAPSRAMPTDPQAVKPRSTHLADPSLQPFLAPTFDPTDYLNATLPPLSISSRSQSAKGVNGAVSLPELSTQTQTVLSQLNAHTSRLSNTLTQLTDEILRSGSRLAYEVEVLRGESLGLTETLNERLVDDLTLFTPAGLAVGSTGLTQDAAASADASEKNEISVGDVGEFARKDDLVAKSKDDLNLPLYMTELRTLSLVKTRLDTVIKTFGDAMGWTLPPSEVSISSSFISVSAPEPGSESSGQEEKGQAVAEKLRTEVTDLLHTGGSGEDALEAAIKRVQEIRELAQVWKGTVEEKARMKFVEGLIRLIEERQKTLEKEAASRQASHTSSASGNSRKSAKIEATATVDQGRFAWPGRPSGGYGLIDQLQKMRGG